MAAKVLIVEDEEGIASLVRDALQEAGIDCVHAGDGPAALTLVGSTCPDLVVLDLVLPGMDGLEVCRRLRGDTRTSHLPIIMVTGRAGEVDRVVGLELGADDYVVKPFSARELLARVKALLRRASPKTIAETKRVGLVELDEARHQLRVDGKQVELTATEFLILNALMSADGRVLGREQLRQAGSGATGGVRLQSRSVDVHMSHLRDKLGPEGRRLVTVKGVGYRFDDT